MKIVEVNIFEALISLVASHNCVVCDVEGSLLCPGCLNSELTEVGGRCYRCHKASRNQAVCKDCRKSVPIRHSWIATDYGEVPKKLVHKLKFERAIAGAVPIAEKIDEIVPNLPKDTIVCHIPTASSRVRMRGYDQANEIAKHFSGLRGYKQRSLLLRKGKLRQVGASRTDRFKHLERAFRVKDLDLKQTKILLIDDITTTGATIEAAAKMLKKAGVKTIDVAVFAQA
ncbi:MAG: phosphoribosyltransferase family protein [Candidatus Saccharimonadales bacterium]